MPAKDPSIASLRNVLILTSNFLYCFPSYAKDFVCCLSLYKPIILFHRVYLDLNRDDKYMVLQLRLLCAVGEYALHPLCKWFDD